MLNGKIKLSACSLGENAEKKTVTKTFFNNERLQQRTKKTQIDGEKKKFVGLLVGYIYKFCVSGLFLSKSKLYHVFFAVDRCMCICVILHLLKFVHIMSSARNHSIQNCVTNFDAFSHFGEHLEPPSTMHRHTSTKSMIDVCC